MSSHPHFVTLELHAGADIANAFANSQVAVSKSLRRGFGGIQNAVNFARILRRGRLMPRHCVATGRERDSGEVMTLLFSGFLRATNLWAAEILGSSKFELHQIQSAADVQADVIITDQPWVRPILRWNNSIRIPNWVRQELPVASTWDETVSAIPIKLRKDIARLLRKYGYRLCLDQRFDAPVDFYRELHLPHVRARFGNDALAVDEAEFLHETRNTTRLNLIHEDSIVAASLVDTDGDRLRIRRSSTATNAEWLKGRSDVLDYFCLLLAQLLSCKYLDFGRSRPFITDGPLRYKAKWQTRITPAGGLKPDTCVSPIRPTAATLSFLRRNHFIQNANGTSVVRVLYDNDSTPDAIIRLVKTTRNLGLHEVQLVCHPKSPVDEPTVRLPSNIQVQFLTDPHDPIYRLLKDA